MLMFISHLQRYIEKHILYTNPSFKRHIAAFLHLIHIGLMVIMNYTVNIIV